FPKAEFGYKVTGTIRITSFSYTWKLLITYRLLDKDEQPGEDDPGEYELPAEPFPEPIGDDPEDEDPEEEDPEEEDPEEEDPEEEDPEEEDPEEEDPEEEDPEPLILEDESVPASISQSEALPKLLFEETLTERAHSALQ